MKTFRNYFHFHHNVESESKSHNMSVEQCYGMLIIVKYCSTPVVTSCLAFDLYFIEFC